MRIEEYMDNLTSKEINTFQKICRELLKSTFIVREINEDGKKDFNFISRNEELFCQFFELIGYILVLDRTSGVAMIKNQANSGESGKLQSNRLALKLNESIILCSLWLLYADRMTNGSLTQAITVSKTDLDYELEKFNARDLYDKNTITKILELFSKYNLIRMIGKIGEPDCLIRLYPSMQFCMDVNEFKTFVENSKNRMQEKKTDELQSDEEGYPGNEADL